MSIFIEFKPSSLSIERYNYLIEHHKCLFQLLIYMYGSNDIIAKYEDFKKNSSEWNWIDKLSPSKSINDNIKVDTIDILLSFGYDIPQKKIDELFFYTSLSILENGLMPSVDAILTRVRTEKFPQAAITLDILKSYDWIPTYHFIDIGLETNNFFLLRYMLEEDSLKNYWQYILDEKIKVCIDFLYCPIGKSRLKHEYERNRKDYKDILCLILNRNFRPSKSLISPIKYMIDNSMKEYELTDKSITFDLFTRDHQRSLLRLFDILKPYDITLDSDTLQYCKDHNLKKLLKHQSNS